MTHELKTWTAPFQAIWDGRKLYEVRRFDRPFAVDDRLVLREYDPEDDTKPAGERYTGRVIHAVVTYVTAPGTWGLDDKIGVLGVRVNWTEQLRDNGGEMPRRSGT